MILQAPIKEASVFITANPLGKKGKEYFPTTFMPENLDYPIILINTHTHTQPIARKLLKNTGFTSTY